MNNSSKILSLLGLAARARKIVTGEELVVKAIQEQRTFFVLLSVDASDNTRKKITNKCEHYNIPYRIQFGRSEIGHSIGKEARVVVAITDIGFSKKLQDLME